jgi:hypothetical protein
MTSGAPCNRRQRADHADIAGILPEGAGRPARKTSPKRWWPWWDDHLQWHPPVAQVGADSAAYSMIFDMQCFVTDYFTYFRKSQFGD